MSLAFIIATSVLVVLLLASLGALAKEVREHEETTIERNEHMAVSREKELALQVAERRLRGVERELYSAYHGSKNDGYVIAGLREQLQVERDEASRYRSLYGDMLRRCTEAADWGDE